MKEVLESYSVILANMPLTLEQKNFVRQSLSGIRRRDEAEEEKKWVGQPPAEKDIQAALARFDMIGQAKKPEKEKAFYNTSPGLLEEVGGIFSGIAGGAKDILVGGAKEFGGTLKTGLGEIVGDVEAQRAGKELFERGRQQAEAPAQAVIGLGKEIIKKGQKATAGSIALIAKKLFDDPSYANYLKEEGIDVPQDWVDAAGAISETVLNLYGGGGAAKQVIKKPVTSIFNKLAKLWWHGTKYGAGIGASSGIQGTPEGRVERATRGAEVGALTGGPLAATIGVVPSLPKIPGAIYEKVKKIGKKEVTQLIPPKTPPGSVLERTEPMISKTPEELMAEMKIDPKQPFKKTVEKVGKAYKEIYRDAQKSYTEAAARQAKENPQAKYDLSAKAMEMENVLSGNDSAGNSFGLTLKEKKVPPKPTGILWPSGEPMMKPQKPEYDVVSKKGVPNRFTAREMGLIQKLMDELTSKKMEAITPEGLITYRQMISKYYDAVPIGPSGPSPYHALIMKMANKGDNIVQNFMSSEMKTANQKYVRFHEVREAFGNKIVDAEGNIKTGAESYFKNLSGELKGETRAKIAKTQETLGIDVLGEVEKVSGVIKTAKGQPKIIEAIEVEKGKTRGGIQKLQNEAQSEYDSLLKRYEKDVNKLATEKTKFRKKWARIIGGTAVGTILGSTALKAYHGIVSD